jgi:hypothetical protein
MLVNPQRPSAYALRESFDANSCFPPCNGCPWLCGDNSSSAATISCRATAAPAGCLTCVVATTGSSILVGRDHRFWPSLLWWNLEGNCFDRRESGGPLGRTERLHSRRRGGGRLHRRPAIWRWYSIYKGCRRPTGVLAGANSRRRSRSGWRPHGVQPAAHRRDLLAVQRHRRRRLFRSWPRHDGTYVRR